MNYSIKYLAAVFSLFLVKCVAVNSSTSSDGQSSAVQRWQEADKMLRKLASGMVKDLLPVVLRMFEELSLSPDCSKMLLKFLTGIKQTKTWAFRMLDSSGKIPNGIWSGSLNSLGDYDLCLDTDVPGSFRGQYCTLAIMPPVPERVPFTSYDDIIPQFVNITKPDGAANDFLRFAKYYYHLQFRTSVCLPSTCSRMEIEQIVRKAIELSGIRFDSSVPNCETKGDSVSFGASEISIIVVLAILLLVCLVATTLDVILELKDGHKGMFAQYLLCFSFYTNIHRLLKSDDNPDSIKIFHGMKAITILWVILNHTCYYLNYQVLSSLLIAAESKRPIAFQLIVNGFLNVETFFFMSAVLVSYGVMKIKQQKLNIPVYIFYRIWRLTPPYMLVIASTFLIPYLGSGPAWRETVVQGLTAKCKNYWWTNLIFINNFVPNAEMCLNWTWYVPVDTHLYFLSLLVLVPLKRNPRLAFFINGLLLIIGTIVTAVSHVYYKLHPTAISVYIHPDDINYFVDRGYFRTYVHISSYCVGLTVGYLLATKQKVHIPMKVNVLGWVTAITLALAVLYGVYDWNQGRVPGLAVSTLYACTNKLVWSLALAWVTYSCMTGNGGIATKILSWGGFVPLGRLTYMTYLVHPIVQHMFFGSSRTLLRPDYKGLVFLYLANVMMGFMCAFALSLLFESPFMALQKLLISKKLPDDDIHRQKEKTGQSVEDRELA